MRRFVPSLFGILLFGMALHAQVSSPPTERVYDAPMERVRQFLQQVATGGKLPALDGFVPTEVDQLDRYQRPHYEFRVETVAADATHTRVRLQARISAWYADPAPDRSEYRSLPSNGRLEADLLDRLQDELGPSLTGDSIPARAATGASSAVRGSDAGSLLQRELENLRQQRQALESKSKKLSAEAAQWDQQIREQKAEAGFATVKRSGAAVMARMSYSGPVLFRTRSEDEFEPIAQENEWIQVRTGRDSTGWMLADELALPEGVMLPKASGESSDAMNSPAFSIREQPTALAKAAIPVPGNYQSDLGQSDGQSKSGFWISHEEVKVFSGEWTKLKGKKALFVFAQPRGFLSGMASDDRKLAFAKQLFTGRYPEASRAGNDYEGIVVIFTGGKNAVAAALVTDIRDWANGKISDAAFIQRCSLDPADEFRSAEAIASSTK